MMSQPHARLGYVVVVTITPWAVCDRLVISALGNTGVVGAAMFFTSGRRALIATLLGTGDTSIRSGTWMNQLHFGSTESLVVSRLGSSVATAAVSWWVRKRRPDVVVDPVLLVGLRVTAWSLRLVMEENLFGYCCVATGATLVLRDIIVQLISRGTAYLLFLVLISFGKAKRKYGPWELRPTRVYQLFLAPSAFMVALYSLRTSMLIPTSHDSEIGLRT